MGYYSGFSVNPPRKYSGTTYADAAAFIDAGKNPVNRRIGATSYLTRLGERNWPSFTIGLVLHSTVVVAYHADGTYTLDHGGYQTRTTANYINSFSPFWMYSTYDRKNPGWVLSYTGKTTPPKVQSCRTCWGTGFDSWLLQRARKENPGSRRLNTAELGKCYRCDGNKVIDYGSKAIPIVWGKRDDPVRMAVRKRKQRGNAPWLSMQKVVETDVQRLWAPEFRKSPPPWRPEYIIQGL